MVVKFKNLIIEYIDDNDLDFEKREKIADRFRLKRKLGAGAFGQVWEARDTLLAQNIAIKISKDNLKKETKMLRKMPKDAYMSIFDYEKDKDREVYAYTMELLKRPWINLEEFKSKNLRSMFKDKDRRKELYALRIILYLSIDILKGISALHGKKYAKSNRWCHGDIKPLNLYINLPKLKAINRYDIPEDHISLVKIGDLGLVSGYGRRLYGGTPGYAAPEQYGEHVYPSTDIFSIAQTISALIMGTPFDSEELKRINRIKNSLGRYISSTFLLEKISNILREMTKTTPNQRINADEAIFQLSKLIRKDEEWQLLEIFYAPNNFNGITLTDATDQAFKCLSKNYGWKNRNTERLNVVKTKIRNMYRRRMVFLDGHRYKVYA